MALSQQLQRRSVPKKFGVSTVRTALYSLRDDKLIHCFLSQAFEDHEK